MVKNKKGNNSILKSKYTLPIGIIAILTIVLIAISACNKTYTITFDTGKTLEIKAGEKINIQTPSKEGYTFEGWYLDGKLFDINTKIHKNISLKAKWKINEYEVIIDTGLNKTNLKVEYNKKVQEPDVPLRSGYTFLGWYVNNEKFDFDTLVTKDILIVAKWQKTASVFVPVNYVDYTVEHYQMDLKGDFPKVPTESEVLRAEENSKVSPDPKEYEGFSKPTIKEVDVKSDGSTVIKYYYIRNKYILTLEKDDGIESALGEGTYYYGEKVDIKYSLKEGYKFSHYSLDLKNDVFTVPASDTVLSLYSSPNNDTVYTVKHYKMNLNGEYEVEPDEIEVLKGTTDSKVMPKVKTYEGFTSPQEKEISIDGNGNTILEYKYSRNKYVLTLNMDIGYAEAMGAGTYYYDEEIEINYGLRPGYSFVGYNEDVIDNVLKMPARNVDLDLISKPNDDTVYTVKHYKMNLDGEYEETPFEIETFTGTTDTKVVPKVKTYDGFTSPQEKEINIDGNGHAILEYKYSRNKYNIILNKDNGIASLSGDGEYYYETLVKISATLKPGYDFVGWSNDITDLKFDYKILDNTEINAITKPIIYNIKYNYNGGAVEDEFKNPETYTVEDEITLNKPSKIGYTFVGWKINNIESDGIIKNSIGSLNVEAIFVPNDDTLYTVEHYQMDLDGINYTLVDTDHLEGTSDSMVTPKTKTYVGFTSPKETAVKVNPDGTTVLTYKYSRNKYKLILNKSKGIDNVSASNTYYYGEKVSITANVSQGYIFNEWKQALEDTKVKEGIISFDYYIMPASNVTLTATATPIDSKYNVEYYFMDIYGNYSDKADKVLEYSGLTDTVPNVTVNEVYGFNKPVLKDSADSKEQKLENYLIKGNGSTVLRYYFERKKFNLTLNKSGDAPGTNYKVIVDGNEYSNLSDSLSIEIYYNKNIDVKLVPFTGINFVEWTSESISDKKNNVYNFTITENTTLSYTMNINRYTIEFNGASGLTEDKDSQYMQDFTYDLTPFSQQRLAPNKFKKDGYTFIGWSKNNNGVVDYQDKVIVRNLTTTNFGIVKLYAVWEANKYTVKFDKNGGSGDDYTQTLTYDKKENLISNKYSKTGYVFAGWSLDKDGEVAYDNESEVTNLVKEGEIVLYAKWIPVNYTVMYHSNNKEDKTVTDTFTYDGTNIAKDENTFNKEQTITYKYNNGDEDKTTEPYKSTLKCWKLDNSETCYIPGENIKDNLSNTAGVVNLYASWVDPTVKLEIPKKTGYNFVGWTLDNKVIDNNYVLKENVTLEAKWEPITYQIKYDGNNNTTGEMSNSKYTYDEESKLSKNTYKKYYNLTYNYNASDLNNKTVSYENEFLGWYDKNNKDYVDEAPIYNLTTTDKEIITLYAKWENPTISLEKPIRTGYIFNGWYISDESNLINDNYTLESSITLNAKWTPIKYDVVYKSNNGKDETKKETFTYDGNNIAAPSNTFSKSYKATYNYVYNEEIQEKTYYATLKCWKFNGKCYTPGVKISDNLSTIEGTIELYAEWVNPTVDLDKPKRDGYLLAGWQLNDKNIGLNYTFESDINVNAIWTPITYNVHYDGNNNTTGEMPDSKHTYDDINSKVNENKYEKSYNIIYDFGYAIDNKIVEKQYKFIGWSLEKNGSVTIQNNGQTGNLTNENNKTVNLYAQWEEEYIDMIEDPERLGYTFEGWYDGGTKVTTLNGISKNTTLTAKWTPKDGTVYKVNHYKMDINGNYPKEPTETDSFKGKTESSVTPEVKDYVGFKKPPKETTTIKGDGTTVVNYKYEREKYTITLKGDKGVSDLPKTINDYYEKEVDITVKLKAGYEFVKWSNNVGTLNFKHTITSNQIFTVTTKPTEYNITYDYKNGTVKENPKTYNIESDITLNKPTKEGYTFKYWKINNQINYNGVIKNKTGALKVEAVYDENTLTVNYNNNTGTGTMTSSKFKYTDKAVLTNNSLNKSYTITYNYNDNIKPTKIESHNATFKGWALTPTGDVKFNNSEDISTYVKNETKNGNKTITLYAKWENPTVKLDVPARTAYMFNGWLNNDVLITDTTLTLSKNITLKASWSYIIIWDYDVSILTKKDTTNFNTTLKDNVYTVDVQNVSNTMSNVLSNIKSNAKAIFSAKNSHISKIVVKFDGTTYNITSSNVDSVINTLFTALTKTSSISKFANRNISSLYDKSLTAEFVFESGYTSKNNLFTVNFTSSNVVSIAELQKLSTSVMSKINVNKARKYEVSIDPNNPSKIWLKYISSIKNSYLTGSFSGAGIKTALWNLLGNPSGRGSENYPRTGIYSVTFTFEKTGKPTTVEVMTTEKVQGWNWMDSAEDVAGRLAAIMGKSLWNLTNADLDNLSAKIKIAPYSGKVFQDGIITDFEIYFGSRTS